VGLIVDAPPFKEDLFYIGDPPMEALKDVGEICSGRINGLLMMIQQDFDHCIFKLGLDRSKE
jgi:hypothetical protein